MFLVVLFIFWRQDRNNRSAANRGMFQFNDGLRDRWVDPISVQMAFENHPEYVADLHPKMVANGNKEATMIVVDAIKKAFGVVDYQDPKRPGLTIAEMLGLWTAFYTWVDLQKKSMQYERIYAESLEQTLNESGEKTTNSTSDSGSTEIELSPSNPSA